MSCCCTKKETISCENAPAAIGPYSVAVSTGSLVFVSGQLGLDKETGSLVAGGIQAQARKALENMKAILESAGLSMDFPARSAIQVAGLPKNGIVEIEAIAVKQHDHEDKNCCCNEN